MKNSILQCKFFHWKKSVDL